MCRTYHWTCHICARAQTRRQPCSNTLAGTVNCPNNSRADAPPPQAEHNGLRCPYCYAPSLKTESHSVNPAASFATNARWDPRHAIMSPSRDTNGQQQPAPSDYPGLSSAMAAATLRTHPAMTTTHHQYSNSGHAQPVLPPGQHPHHRLPAAPGTLPILAQQQQHHHHHHGRFASPTPPSLPIDPLLAHPHGRPHRHAVRADSHAAATPPPFQPHAPPSTPAEHHLSPEQALPLHPHASPTAAAATAATGGGRGGGEGPATGAAHLRPTADMLASMTATRTALFAEAEGRRAAAIEKAQSGAEQNAAKQGPDVAGDAEVEAAWYAMWAGCGVSPAAVSAAQTAAAVERRAREKRKEDATSHGNQETSGTGQA